MLKNYISKLQKIECECYIFGAGRVAKVIHEIAIENGISVDSFLVTDIRQNKKLYMKKFN